jgi:AbrB family looped-hinge helix DNA binding protein
MTTATISTKGLVVIPADLRRKYGLAPGDRVQIVDYGGVISIVPQLREPVTDAMGMLSGPTSLTSALISERRSESERENRRLVHPPRPR